MKRLFSAALAAAAALAVAACKKQAPQASSADAPAPAAAQPAADNAATRYVGTLQRDEQRAKAAADAMTRSIQNTSGEVNKADQPQ